MQKKRRSFWDILAWVALASIVVWLILKVLGIINTPLLLEFAPYFAAVYVAGWQVHKLHTVSEDVRDLKKFKNETIRKINHIESNCRFNYK